MNADRIRHLFDPLVLENDGRPEWFDWSITDTLPKGNTRSWYLSYNLRDREFITYIRHPRRFAIRAPQKLTDLFVSLLSPEDYARVVAASIAYSARR
jgi:hypothetical protein